MHPREPGPQGGWCGCRGGPRRPQRPAHCSHPAQRRFSLPGSLRGHAGPQGAGPLGPSGETPPVQPRQPQTLRVLHRVREVGGNKGCRGRSGPPRGASLRTRLGGAAASRPPAHTAPQLSREQRGRKSAPRGCAESRPQPAAWPRAPGLADPGGIPDAWCEGTVPTPAGSAQTQRCAHHPQGGGEAAPQSVEDGLSREGLRSLHPAPPAQTHHPLLATAAQSCQKTPIPVPCTPWPESAPCRHLVLPSPSVCPLWSV